MEIIVLQLADLLIAFIKRTASLSPETIAIFASEWSRIYRWSSVVFVV